MEEEIYHAELADAKRETNILNGLAGTTIAVSLVFLMLGVTLDAVVDKSASEEEDLGVRVLRLGERKSQLCHRPR